jgi:hypothetical protein
MPIRTFTATILLLLGISSHAASVYIPPPDEGSADDIEIVAGEDRTIFEYRTNGILMMIKIVPKNGKPYYMVPADGSPHFKSLDHSKKLYPQWVILEW